MQVLLISTYELGHQPFGLASPAAWLRRAGFEVTAVDTSRDRLQDEAIRNADLAAFYLPMHTATRLSLPLIERVKQLNPGCHLCCFGIYAPLNGNLLRELGVETILDGEFEAGLVELAGRRGSPGGLPGSTGGTPAPPGRDSLPHLAFIQPDRSGLPTLDRYAALRVGDEHRTAGYTEASRGCKHLCRHCPIVPVYNGRFRVVPVDVVMADIGAQVEQGASHITFGDPDFFNGIGHALRIVEHLARRFPGVTYDVTIKIEHLLKHAGHLRTLAGSGCLFVTSAVEALDDRVLAILAKGHTRADFEQVVGLCREAGLPLSPTFVAFTPWTTMESYLDLLETIERLDLVTHVAPIQLALRLLITNGSLLLQRPARRADSDAADGHREAQGGRGASPNAGGAAHAGDRTGASPTRPDDEVDRSVPGIVGEFDPVTLVHPWRHREPRIDALQDAVMRTVGARPGAPRQEVFDEVVRVSREWAGQTNAPSWRRGGQDARGERVLPTRNAARARATIPYLDEPWYC